MASPDPAAISTGAGLLWSAPLGTTEPADHTAAWPSGWTKLGYTKEGHTQGYGLTFENIEVAEALDPIKRITTKRDITVKFALAEITLTHLKIALNGGTITSYTGGSYYEPPDVGSEVRIMLGWDSEDADQRMIWRKVLQTGNVETSRKKGADYALFSVEFGLEVPTSAKVLRYFAATARV